MRASSSSAPHHTPKAASSGGAQAAGGGLPAGRAAGRAGGSSSPACMVPQGTSPLSAPWEAVPPPLLPEPQQANTDAGAVLLLVRSGA